MSGRRISRKNENKKGNKNYPLSEEENFDTVILCDEISDTIFAKAHLRQKNFVTDPFFEFDNLLDIKSPKIESKIIEEKIGIVAGVNDVQAKGTAKAADK